ncbi:kielin/chordin-like protein isoform X2 [Linepithema humile]|uniref:kielin/chordin-like protein isoform X2 n=1 Tax=Linepithema humile TaxID=83485 RepID=UPI00351F1CAC
MTRRVSLVQIYACLAFVIAIVTTDQDVCDKTKCLGPLEYYKLLDCKPVYEKEGDCCAIKYNCDHLKERLKDKCYVNGKEYQIGEHLKDEDRNPCDIGCTCIENNGVAAFVCAGIDCVFAPTRPGCFSRSIPSQCCGNEEVCPENPEDRATCVVDGKTYKDGEYFEVKNEPDMTCICRPGYEGKNVEPFCVKSKHPYCSPDFRNARDISENCAPVFYSDQPPQTSCSLSTRCQNDNDTVIHNHDDLKSGETLNENVCLLGNLKMHIGDELSRGTDYSSTCVKCICEVPPVPTCQRLSDNECDFSPIF